MSSANRPARLNRSVLGLLGILLLAAGGFGLAVHFGRLTILHPGAAVLPHPAAPRTWVLYVVAGGAVVAGLLCLRWLAAQLRIRPRARIWQLETDPAGGRTELATTTAVAPFTGEVAAYPGVRSASALLSGPHRAPALSMTVYAAQDADLTAIREQLAAEGLPRLRQALDLDALPVEVTFRVGSGSAASTR